jgi:hypothetical protein
LSGGGDRNGLVVVGVGMEQFVCYLLFGILFDIIVFFYVFMLFMLMVYECHHFNLIWLLLFCFFGILVFIY